MPAANTFGMELRECSESWSEIGLGRLFQLVCSPGAGSAALMLSLVIFSEEKPVISVLLSSSACLSWPLKTSNF